MFSSIGSSLKPGYVNIDSLRPRQLVSRPDVNLKPVNEPDEKDRTVTPQNVVDGVLSQFDTFIKNVNDAEGIEPDKKQSLLDYLGKAKQFLGQALTADQTWSA